VILRSIRFSRLVVGSTLAAAVLTAWPAAAEPSEADRASARALAAEGYDALERKDYAKAVDRFRHADALVHAPTISVDLARSLVGLGRLVEASERYQLVLREGLPKNAPASWKKALDDAQAEAADLEPRLAWIVIHVMGPLDPEVTINGDKVPEGAIGARRAADPGSCTVRATADGFEPEEQTIALQEGGEQTVTLVLKRAPAGPKPAAEPQAGPAQATPAKPDNSRIPAWVAYGVGGAGLIVGSITGVLALGAHSNLEAECPSGECQPHDDAEHAQMSSELSRYHTFGTISGIGFGVAIAGAATGTVLLLTGSKEKSRPAKAAIWPELGPGKVGVAGRF
jgi:hypothetical protein